MRLSPSPLTKVLGLALSISIHVTVPILIFYDYLLTQALNSQLAKRVKNEHFASPAFRKI